MLARKDAVVKQNNDGIVYLFKKNKVAFFHGRGSFAKAVDGGYEVAVAGAANEALTAKHIEHEYFLGPGKHDFVFWTARVPKSLAFLRDHTVKPQ